MELNEYYQKRHYIDLGTIYELTLADSYRIATHNNVNKIACKKLQEYLQEIFYGNNPNYDGLRQAVTETVMQKYVEKYEESKQINLSTLGDASPESVLDNLDKIIREKHEWFKHNIYIKRETLELRLKKVNELIKKSYSNLKDIKNIDTLTQIEQEILELQKLLNDLLKSCGSEEKLIIENNSHLLDNVNKMNALYEAISVPNTAYDANQIGELFEWALAAAASSGGEIALNLGQQLIQNTMEEMEQALTGAEHTSGNNIKMSVAKISSNIKDVPKKYQKKAFFLDGFGYVWEQNVAIDKARQGKMDIFFNLGENNLPSFRISAKNWSNMSIIDQRHSFGSIDLLTALRSFQSAELAEEIVFFTGDPEIKNSYDDLMINRIYKLCAILDILMGYSQSDQYADTLVMNDRANSRIIVRSMSDMISYVTEKMDKIVPYGFDKFHREEMQNMFLNLHELYKNNGSSNQIISHLNSYLSSIKVRLLASLFMENNNSFGGLKI